MGKRKNATSIDDSNIMSNSQKANTTKCKDSQKNSLAKHLVRLSSAQQILIEFKVAFAWTRFDIFPELTFFASPSLL